jgi:hypothetical protein
LRINQKKNRCLQKKVKRVGHGQLFLVYASANSFIRALILISSSSANSGLSLIKDFTASRPCPNLVSP